MESEAFKMLKIKKSPNLSFTFYRNSAQNKKFHLLFNGQRSVVFQTVFCTPPPFASYLLSVLLLFGKAFSRHVVIVFITWSTPL